MKSFLILGIILCLGLFPLQTFGGAYSPDAQDKKVVTVIQKKLSTMDELEKVQLYQQLKHYMQDTAITPQVMYYITVLFDLIALEQ